MPTHELETRAEVVMTAAIGEWAQHETTTLVFVLGLCSWFSGVVDIKVQKG